MCWSCWEEGGACAQGLASGRHPALSFSGSRFVDTSSLIRLPDDCTVGYIIECKLGQRLQPSPLFHSHLETLQLLGAAELLEQVSRLQSRGPGWERGVSPNEGWGT